MMRLLFLSVLFFFASISGFTQKSDSDLSQTTSECLSLTEQHLGRMINEYRESKGLPRLTLSRSLSRVAAIHCADLLETYTHSGRCNLHSWSDSGQWSACCYTDDHKEAACMWEKPRELSDYEGDGFEIAYYTTRALEDPEAYANDILVSWIGSPGHHAVIVNKGIWKSVEWKAMGIGIIDGYATVWFGKLADPEGVPDLCDDK